jgi:hypothetical protein
MDGRFCVLLAAATFVSAVPAVPTFAASTTPRPKLTCDAPSTNHAPAPAAGAQGTYPAGSAGSVVVQRADATNLQIVKTNPSGGWTPQVVAQSGPKVRVKFVNAGSGEVERFASSLNKKGTEIHNRATHCHH